MHMHVSARAHACECTCTCVAYDCTGIKELGLVCVSGLTKRWTTCTCVAYACTDIQELGFGCVQMYVVVFFIYNMYTCIYIYVEQMFNFIIQGKKKG